MENEKYRWHDLKNDPTDLPKEGGHYLTIDQSLVEAGLFLPEVLIWQMGNDFGLPIGWRSNQDWIYCDRFIRNIRAWKEIEPFFENL